MTRNVTVFALISIKMEQCRGGGDSVRFLCCMLALMKEILTLITLRDTGYMHMEKLVENCTLLTPDEL